MENSLVKKDEFEATISDVEKTRTLCKSLLATKHYDKLQEAGIFAVVMKARSLGIHPLEALNGALYYVQGKVELSAITMAKLIRQQGHSITKDKTSDDTICILHGRRKDNGDTWRTSFSLADAKRAGLYKDGSPWSKYPDIMCYSRALSKLARQLFPDVIGNCYVEGEISGDGIVAETAGETVEASTGEIVAPNAHEALSAPEHITEAQSIELDALIGDKTKLRANFMAFLKNRFGADLLIQIPAKDFEVIKSQLSAYREPKPAGEVPEVSDEN